MAQRKSQWDDDPIKANIEQTIATHLINALKPYISKQTIHMLDFGCGSGGITIELSKHVQSIVGIDPSVKATDLFRQKLEDLDMKNSIEVITMDLLSDTNRQFIVEHHYNPIVCSMTFHHVDNVQKAFNVVYEMLESSTNSDGIFVFCDLLKNDHSINFHPIATRSHVSHLGGFTTDDMVHFTTAAGFRELRIEYFTIDKMNAETNVMDQFTVMLAIALKCFPKQRNKEL